jgi:hypothetical protein
MNIMPGFTAEKSIAKTSRHYHTTALFGQAIGFLQPAQTDISFCLPCLFQCCAFKAASGIPIKCRQPCGCPPGVNCNTIGLPAGE